MMPRKPTGGFAIMLALGAIAAAPPPASATAGQSDVQCLLLSNFFSKSAGEQKARDASIAAHFFYLGRLNGRAPGQDLAPAIVQAGRTITPALAGAAMQACVKAMGVVEAQSEEAGKRAQALQPKPPAAARPPAAPASPQRPKSPAQPG